LRELLIQVLYALLAGEIAELSGVQGADKVYFPHHLVAGKLGLNFSPQSLAFGFAQSTRVGHGLQLRQADDFNRSVAQDSVDQVDLSANLQVGNSSCQNPMVRRWRSGTLASI